MSFPTIKNGEVFLKMWSRVSKSLKMPPQEKAMDIILLLVTLILVTIGTVMIYSSSSILAMKKFNDGQYFLKKQIFFVLLGLGIMVLMTKIPYDRLKKLAYPGVLLSAVLLSLLLIPHIGIRAGGATRWLKVGFFSFQVTEMVKVSMVLFLAHFLTKKYSQIADFKRAVLLPLVVILFIVGLILLEPDFGTAVIISLIMMLMFYLAGCKDSSSYRHSGDFRARRCLAPCSQKLPAGKVDELPRSVEGSSAFRISNHSISSILRLRGYIRRGNRRRDAETFLSS